MTSRFFKSALSALLVSVGTLAAQTATPPPAATPAEKKPKEGFVRFWNVLPREAGELLLLQDTGVGEGAPLLAAAPMNYYVGYVGTKPGRYALKLVRSADPKATIKTFDVTLKADAFITFIARMVDGKASFEMLDDTFDPAKALTGKLVVRQCVPGATVTITSTAIPPAAPLGAGDERVFESLPLQSVLVRMQAVLPDGKPKNWACEVDFRSCRHASLWLVQDAHGRFRPRLSPDGQAEITYTEK